MAQAVPAGLLTAKSAETVNGSATQHSPKQLAQSARNAARPMVAVDSSDTLVIP
ncbi:hypothetical protein GCM10022245_66940 [Streptomyces mayteni]